MVAEIDEFTASRGVERTRETVEDVTDALYSKADDMKHTAKDFKKQAYHAGEKFREWTDTVIDQAEDARHKIEGGIRERPFLSSFALFAAGILTARMMARK